MTNSWIICPVCRGNGTHVNPSIDAHGLSRDDFDADPDFRDDYLNGAYDVRCQSCNGTGKIRKQAWAARAEALAEAAQDRKLAMAEDGIWEPGLGDYRYGA